jgi:hypothetical protein
MFEGDVRGAVGATGAYAEVGFSAAERPFEAVATRAKRGETMAGD